MRIPASASISRLAGAAAIASVFMAAPSFAQGGHGPNTDSVTGWRCLSPFCDVVVQPRTRCLCRKDNPNEEVAARLRLTCLPYAAGQSCAQTTRFTIN